MKKSYLVFFTILCLFVLPWVWSSNRVSNLGGDDSRLYLIHPKEYLESVSVNSWFTTAGVGAFNPQFFYIPINIIGLLLQKIFFFLNLQKIFLGLILSLGFIGTYLSINLLVGKLLKNSVYFVWPSLLGGLNYVFFPLVFYTYWEQPLQSVFGIALYPLLFYCFFKAIIDQNISFLIIGAIFSAIFSVAVAATPFILPFIIGTSIFTIFYLLLISRNKKHIFYSSSIFLVLVVLLNAFWLFPFLFSMMYGNPVGATLFGSQGKLDSTNVLFNMASPFSIFYTLIGLLSKGFFINFSSWGSREIGLNYSFNIIWINILLCLITFSGLFLKGKKIPFSKNKILLILVITTLSLAYLQTINIGSWGIPFFQWMLEHVPGIVGIRTFYHKIPISYAFYYSLTLGISLSFILQLGINKILQKIILICAAISILIIGYPFYSGKINNADIVDSTRINRNVIIPQNYYDLLDHIDKNFDDSRILTFPLTHGTWSIFKSDYKNGLYIGGPPTTFLKAKTTISGRTAFNSSYFSDLEQVISKAFQDKDYTFIKRLLGFFNTKYVLYNPEVYDTDIPYLIRNQFLWPNKLFDNKKNSDDFFNSIVNDVYQFNKNSIGKISDDTYVPKLYIPRKIISESIPGSNLLKTYLSSPDYDNRNAYIYDKEKNISKEMFSEDYGKSFIDNKTSITFLKMNQTQYIVQVKNPPSKFVLSFLDGYHPGWNAYLRKPSVDINKMGIISTEENFSVTERKYTSSLLNYPLFGYKDNLISQEKHFLINGYANGWMINTDDNKLVDNTIEIFIDFWPQQIFKPSVIISLLSLVLSVVYLLLRLMKIWPKKI